MERWIEVLAILGGGISSVALSAWWLGRLVNGKARAFDRRAAEQEKQVAVLNAEMQLYRVEVSRLRSELTAMGCAVGWLIEGPPSMRAPAQKAS